MTTPSPSPASPTPTISNSTWIISCPKCARWRTLGEVRGVRIGAASAGKRTLGWCRQCRRPRMMRIEQARKIAHDRLGAMIDATEPSR